MNDKKKSNLPIQFLKFIVVIAIFALCFSIFDSHRLRQGYDPVFSIKKEKTFIIKDEKKEYNDKEITEYTGILYNLYSYEKDFEIKVIKRIWGLGL